MCWLYYIHTYFYQGGELQSTLVCSDPFTGPSQDLEKMVSTYVDESKYSDQRMKDICSGVSVCCYSSVSLGDYALERSEFCSRTHHQPCRKCSELLKVANTILKEGFITLREAYQLVSPNTKYDTEKAKRMLLQLPLASIRVGQPNSGTAFTLLVEHQQSVDYDKLSVMINSLLNVHKLPQSVLINQLFKSC